MKTKKGFTLIELISVIALLGIILIVVGTKGFGAFDNTKEKISIENKNTIKEAANFLMTEVKSCDGNEDIYGNLFDKYLTDDEKNDKPCEKLIEKATKKEGDTGCLDIYLNDLIKENYISSNGVKEINNHYPDYKIKGCLEPGTKKVIVALPKEEDLTSTTTTTSSTTSTTTTTTSSTTTTTKKTNIGPEVVYYDEENFVQYRNPLYLRYLSDFITCYDKENDRVCKELEVIIYLDSKAKHEVYYNAKWTEFENDKSGRTYNISPDVILEDNVGGILGDDANEYDIYKLRIIGRDYEDDETVIDADLPVEWYALYEPIISYNNPKTDYTYSDDDLDSEFFLQEIKDKNITCTDPIDGSDCVTITYEIDGRTLSGHFHSYTRSYNLYTGESELLYGSHYRDIFDPGTYTLFIEGCDTYNVCDDIVETLYVEEYPYKDDNTDDGMCWYESSACIDAESFMECEDPWGVLNPCN